MGYRTLFDSPFINVSPSNNKISNMCDTILFIYIRHSISPETRQGGRFGLPVLVIPPLPKQYAYFKFRCL